MSDDKQSKRERLVKRIVKEFPNNSLINLGIGLPTLCANHLPKDKTIFLHSENGFIGLGGTPAKGSEDKDIVNAGGQHVTVVPGACYFDSAMSFAIIRGGHIDATVLGALEVDAEGNLANYTIPGKMVPGMGGAMDLVVGAKKVIIAMEHVNKNGEPKILTKCKLPLTAQHQVDVIVTDMAFIRVTSHGLILEELAEGVTLKEVIDATEAKLTVAENLKFF